MLEKANEILGTNLNNYFSLHLKIIRRTKGDAKILQSQLN